MPKITKATKWPMPDATLVVKSPGAMSPGNRGAIVNWLRSKADDLAVNGDTFTDKGVWTARFIRATTF